MKKLIKKVFKYSTLVCEKLPAASRLAYEASRTSARKHSRNAAAAIAGFEPPRYRKDGDGVYRCGTLPSDGTAKILLAGDIMCQFRQQSAALEKHGCFDFRESFDLVKPLFSDCDFAVGNLETMLSEKRSYMMEENRVDGKPLCNAPATFLEAVRYAGFDMVVNANNHNCDTDADGIMRTLGHIDRSGLIHTGLFSNAVQPRYVLAEVRGIRLGFISYSTLYNGFDKRLNKFGRSTLLNRPSASRIKEDIKRLRSKGAQFVIVYIHWGKEYTNTPGDKSKSWAKLLAENGADYIIGSHPHVLQPYELIKTASGKSVPVVFSMGNFLSQMGKDNTREAVILELKLTSENGKVRIAGEGYIPCCTYRDFGGRSYAVVPLTDEYDAEEKETHLKNIAEHMGGELKKV